MQLGPSDVTIGGEETAILYHCSMALFCPQRKLKKTDQLAGFL
jgi:hypothetical protein